MGFLYRGLCHPSISVADDYRYSSESAYTVPLSSSLVQVTSYEKTAGQWQLKVVERKNDGSTNVRFTNKVGGVNIYPACDPMDGVADGMAVGWLVVGAMAIAWGANLVRNQIK